MSIRGVIFDMDGTLTEPYLEFARVKAEAGIGDVDMLDYLRSATGTEYERVHAILMRFEEDGAAKATLNPGARTVLDYLKTHRLPTALLTRNSRKSVDTICRLLKLEFDITVSREEGPHKPAPEPIWQIMKRWGLGRAEVLMVGDYKWDVLCANNAGVPCAVLLPGGEEYEWAATAQYRMRQLTELIDIIEGKRA
jgi:HAD superfamily hydrolase (TIGR01549 family)